MRFNPNTGEFETLQPSRNDGGSSNTESGVGLWGVPFLLIPLIGWIMYFVWRKNKPKKARQANICAIVGFILNVLLRLID